MKRFFPVLLAFIMLMQCSIRAIIVVNFSLNNSYITTNLCENKNRPELCCKGKCYLKKQLDKESSGNTIPKLLKDKFEQWFELPDANIYFYCYKLLTKSGFLFVLQPIPDRFFAVFHPPPIG